MFTPMFRTWAFAALFAAALLTGIGGCDGAQPYYLRNALAEGRELAQQVYGAAPATRAAYARLATFSAAGGTVYIFRPGDAPALVKKIELPLYVTNAYIDRVGLLWVVPRLDAERGPHRHIYVIDPVTATVVTAILLPADLSGPEALAFGEEHVYVRAAGVGLDMGFAVINRRTYAVEYTTVRKDTGGGYEDGIEAYRGKVYLISTMTRDEVRKFEVFDPATRTFTTRLIGGSYTFVGDKLYIVQDRTALARVDAATLEREASVPISRDVSSVRSNGSVIALSYYGQTYTDLRPVSDLSRVERIDLSGEAPGCCTTLPSFGFVSPTLLMLNDHSFYDIATRTLRANVFPVREAVPQSLQLAEGVTLETAGR